MSKNNGKTKIEQSQHLLRLAKQAESEGLKFIHAVFYRSYVAEAPHEDWETVHRDDLPKWVVEDPEVLGNVIRRGYVVNNSKDSSDNYFYRAEAVKAEKTKSKIVLH